MPITPPLASTMDGTIFLLPSSAPSVVNSVFSPSLVALSVISEINAACDASGIAATDAHFAYAGTALLPGFAENLDIHDDLDDLRNSTAAQNLRNDYYADIVVLITANVHTGAVGVARLKASDAKAYCVIEIGSALFNGFGATHEIGHILGARHERCSTCGNVDGCDNKTDHHGFLVGTEMRTIMAQNTCPAGTTRIGNWSNPAVNFMGFATGTSDNNNAAQVRSRADKVSCFRSSPPFGGGSGQGGSPFLVSINGSKEVCNAQGYYPYQAVITTTPAVTYPLSYVWEISPIGVGSWTQVSTTNSYLLTNPASFPNYWMTIRLTVTDAAGNISVGFFEVKRISCFGSGGEDRSAHGLEEGSFESNSGVYLLPNPASESLTIQGIMGGSQISILNMNGKLVQAFMGLQNAENKVSVSLSSIPPGVYIVSIKEPQQASSIKIRFIKL